MKCVICGKSCEEAELYEGILEDGMVVVCSKCAEKEEIPLIRKPTHEAIKKAERRPSVRERMERMSGYRDRSEISDEQSLIQSNLAKLKNPYKKQTHPDVEDNYYWEINMARRRKKMTTNQLANISGVESDVIEAIEKGILIEGFQEIFRKLESALGIKLLKKYDSTITYNKVGVDEEQRILEEVKRKMAEKKVTTKDDQLLEEIDDVAHEEISPAKREKLAKISSGRLDLSKRQNLDDVTLNDLIEMKHNREKSLEKKRERLRTEAMIGDDLEFED